MVFINKTIVSVIIPNWNGAKLLKKHLPTIVKNSDNASFIIVDDHSSDDSIPYIQDNFPNIEIVRTTEHKGFASTVNAGVRAATSDIVVLLNTDVEPEKNFLKPILPHFSDPKVFAVGCMDKSVESGKIVLRGRGIGWWEKGFYIHKRGEVDKTDTAWVSGGSSAFRRSMWNKLGGMDPVFNPFYWEDIDLSYRAEKKGYRILFEPKSIIHHFHEEGKIKKEYSEKEIKRIAFRNQLYFIWKHAPMSQLLLHILWTPLWVARELVKGNSEILRGFINALPLCITIFIRRFDYS